MQDETGDDLLARYPLPEGVPDATLNKTEAAQFFAVSPPTIDAWLHVGMPAEVEGTNGRAWEFSAARIWAWRQAHLAREESRNEAAREAITAMRLNLVNGKTGDSMRGLPPRERKELYEVERAYRQLLLESGRLIEREAVFDGLQDLMSLMRDAVNSLSDRLEREADLKPKQISVVDRIGEETLDQLCARVDEFFSARPLTERLRETDLFNQ